MPAFRVVFVCGWGVGVKKNISADCADYRLEKKGFTTEDTEKNVSADYAD